MNKDRHYNANIKCEPDQPIECGYEVEGCPAWDDATPRTLLPVAQLRGYDHHHLNTLERLKPLASSQTLDLLPGTCVHQAPVPALDDLAHPQCEGEGLVAALLVEPISIVS